MIKKHKKILLIAIGVLLVGTLSLTYAYFAGGAGPGANTDINLTASRTEKLIFNEGDPINLLLNEVTLAQGGGNVTGSSTATATLIASETTNNSAANYNVYLNINFNNFIYTTPTKVPEIIAEITDPTGAKVTSITGLTHTTVTDNQGNTTTGFDITNKVGRFDVKLDEAITSTDSVTGVTENWTIKVTYINLDTNQAANSGNTMDVSFVLDQRDNVLLNEIADPDTFGATIAEVTNDTAPLIDEMRFSSTKSADYETASLKWDVSANTGSEEVIAYIEDHPTDGRILHVQANGDVVFYSVQNIAAILYDEISSNPFKYFDENGVYIQGSLTGEEQSLLCSFYGIDAATCASILGFDESLIKIVNIGSYFNNVNYVNMSLGFDTSNVIDMSYMFYGSAATVLDVSGFDTSKVTDMSYMFYGSDATVLDVSGFDTSNVIDMSSMFSLSAATVLDVSGFDTSNVTNMYDMFWNSAATVLDVSGFDTSNVTNMYDMFRSSAATVLDVSGFDTSKVTDMHCMFCSSAATVLDVSGFNTSEVTDISSMFRSSAATVLDVSGFNTSKVTDMSSMFDSSTATIIDVSGFDTTNVTDMSSMFYSSDATELDVSRFDTSNVTDMDRMFSGSVAKVLDVSGFDTSNVTDMSHMFESSAATVLDVSGFDFSLVTDAENMLYTSSSATTDIYVKDSAMQTWLEANADPRYVTFVVAP